MYLEIVSPEATLYTGDVTAVTLPGINGEFQMLSNHAPVVSLLQKGSVKIKGATALEEANAAKFTTAANGDVVLAIASGTIEMKDNKVIVLVD